MSLESRGDPVYRAPHGRRKGAAYLLSQAAGLSPGCGFPCCPGAQGGGPESPNEKNGARLGNSHYEAASPAR